MFDIPKIMIAALVICLCSGFEPAWGAIIKSGVYENLFIASDSIGRVTGYYEESQGVGVSKSCVFFLVGEKAVSDGRIMTWSCESFPGSITAETNGLTLTIEQGRSQCGCGLVLMPEIEHGLFLERTRETGWSELLLISSDRADLYSDTNSNPRKASSLVKGDVVGVLSRSSSWIEVEHATQNLEHGWIRSDHATVFKSPRQ